MKTKLFFSLLFLFFSTVCFSQVRDLPGTYTIDSCIIITKANPGWQLPDTAQIRLMAPMLKGFAYLTRTLYDGNYVEVEMRNPLRKLIASDMNGNEPAYYSVVLVPATSPVVPASAKP
jgi:hypothetical protein